MTKKLDTVDDVKKAIKVDDLNEMTEEQSKKLYELMPKLDTSVAKNIYENISDYVGIIRKFSDYIIDTSKKLEKDSKDKSDYLYQQAHIINEQIIKETNRLFPSRKRIDQLIDRQIELFKDMKDLKIHDDSIKVQIIGNICDVLKQVTVAAIPIVAAAIGIKLPKK